MSRHLRELGAGPRFVGSDNNARARDYCARVLVSAGYAVETREFRFATVGGRYGAPVIGALLVAAAAAAHLLNRDGRGGPALIGLVVALGIAAIFGTMYGGARMIGREGLSANGVSLVAARAPRPRVWLVAHVDSKSQPISILVRAAGFVLLFAGFAAAAVVSLLVLLRGIPVSTPIPLLLAVLGGAPVLASVVREAGSSGAADNASGVAAVLEAAEGIRQDAVGVIITDGEELALAGAHAIARDLPPAIALNCDTIDDEGAMTIMTVRGSSKRTIGAFRDAHPGLRVMPLIPGILTDSVAFARAGWDSVTLSRGTIRTLSRLHTSKDSLANLRGDGITDAAALLAVAATALADGSE